MTFSSFLHSKNLYIRYYVLGCGELLCPLYDMQTSDLKVSMKLKKIKNQSQHSEILNIVRQNLH